MAKIEAEPRKRSKSAAVRKQPAGAAPSTRPGAIVDLIGSVTGLPGELSTRKKAYLKATRYGGKRPR
jgi:hypothetical protein